MGGIPTGIDDITPAWLAEATGLDVQTARIEQIGVGIGVSSALYRARLTGRGCPATVVIKLPALDEAAVFTSTMLRMYLREAGFFNELAQQAPIRVPACHHASVDEETSQFVLVMEDLGELRGGGPDRGHGGGGCRAGRRRPGPLARHLVGERGATREAGAHGEPRRRDLQGRAPDGLRGGLGEARRRARGAGRDPRPWGPAGRRRCPGCSMAWPRGPPR